MKAYINKDAYENMDPEGSHAHEMKFSPETGLMEINFLTEEELKTVKQAYFKLGWDAYAKRLSLPQEDDFGWDCVHEIAEFEKR